MAGQGFGGELFESLRPILRDWWTRAGKPVTGHVFPPLRGKRAGVDDKTGATHAKTGDSHAEAMRRDLQVATVAPIWQPGIV